MKQKKAYGTGEDQKFPKAADIETFHQGLTQNQETSLNDNIDKVTDEEDTIMLNQFHPDEHGFYDVFGDGSFTTPRNWIIALGGFGLWIPRWPGALKQVTQHGSIKGLKASSTRLELAGWITSLTLPFKNNYATDNAAVVGKATKMLEAAKKVENLAAATGTLPIYSNPFKRAWGSQVDGDLWAQGWEAIKARTSTMQKIRKVKGHATRLHVEEGNSTIKDKIGNHLSDEQADLGVASIKGDALVYLAKWINNRHKDYIKFMNRIRSFIAAVTKVEKQKRENAKAVAKALKGYDPTKFVETTGNIRGELHLNLSFHKIELPPPVIGKHRFSKVQLLYEDIHNFVANRQWAAVDDDDDEHTNTSGITWLELFILFDTGNYRREGSKHVKNVEAANRAAERQTKRKHSGKKAKTKAQHSATVNPSLLEELALFKQLMRHVLQHGASNPEDKKLFAADKRQHLRRLASLGVYGHQPSTRTYCSITEEENFSIIEAILQQKVAPVQKHIQHILKVAKQEIKGEITKIKILRVAFNAVVRWKRKINTNEFNEQQPSWERFDEVKKYTSRLLTCRTCGALRETAWMQLRTPRGIRAVHCLSCKAFQVVSMHKCQCGTIWHQCPTHHIDPSVHRSAGRTAAKFKEAEKDAALSLLPATRKKPTPPQPGKRVKHRGCKEGPSQLRGVHRTSSHLVPPTTEAIKRIRLKEQAAQDRGDLQCESCHRYHPADLLCLVCKTSKCTNCTSYEECAKCRWPLCLQCRNSCAHRCEHAEARDQPQHEPTSTSISTPATIKHTIPSSSREPPATSRNSFIEELSKQSHQPDDQACASVPSLITSSSGSSDNAATQLDRIIHARSNRIRAGVDLKLDPPTKIARTAPHSSNTDDALKRLLSKNP